MELDVKKMESMDYDLLENIKVAFKRTFTYKSVILLSTLVGAIFFVLFYIVVGNTITYSSTATIFSAVYGSYEESVSGISVMNTYSNLLGTYRVCDRAAEELVGYGITSEKLQGMVKSGQIYVSGASTDSKKYGYTLTLVAKSDKSDNVIDITNSMAQAFADEINDLLGQTTLQVLDKSKSYKESNSINEKLYLILFCGGFLGLSIVILFLIEFFSTKVYSINQCERNENCILGIIPSIDMNDSSK